MQEALVRPLAFDLPRAAQGVAVALCIALGLYFGLAEFGDWYLSDLNVYLGAAERVAAGGSPYLIPSSDIHDVFRYAPWFAYAFIPFTWLPLDVTRVVWSALMVVASLWAVYPVARQGPAGLALGVLCGGMLIGVAGSGNVQPLLVAVLVHGINRRSGPLWIALAASLKAVPLVFAGYYLARREWGRLAASLVMTVLLVAPMLLFERPPTTFDPGESLSVWSTSPVAWAIVAGLTGILALVACLSRSRFSGAYLAAAAMLALPRLFVYDVSFALAGSVGEQTPNRDADHFDEQSAPA